jgi:hypothetical protein
LKPRATKVWSRGVFALEFQFRAHARKESPDMRISKRLLLGLGLATLLVESLAFHPALAADKVSLF